MSERPGGLPDRRKNPDRRKGDDSLRRRVEFALRAMLVAAAIFLLAVGVGGWQVLEYVDDVDQATEDTEQAVEDIEAEREARVDTASDVIGLGCVTDNDQDRLLATLVRVALSGGGTFGENVDPAQLDPFQIAVLRAIAEVQQLAADAPPTQLQRIYQRKLRDLEHLAPCRVIVKQYRSGKPLPHQIDRVRRERK